MRLLLARVGGLSPVRQDRDSPAPARRGVWCWIWPKIDLYLLSGMSAQGGVSAVDSNTGKVATRLDQLRHEGMRVFVQRSPVWTHLPVPNPLRERGSWRLVEAPALAAFLPRYGHGATRWTRAVPARWSYDHPSRGGPALGPVHAGVCLCTSYSEMFEVFVERPTGGADPRSRAHPRRVRIPHDAE